MATTSCPSSFKVSGSPTGSKSLPTRRPRNPKPPPDPSGHHQNSAIAPLNMQRALGDSLSQPNPLHLILSETLLRAVIELGGSRALVRSLFLGVLERTAIGEIGGDPGGTERMAADRLGNAGRSGATPDHAPGIGLAHRFLG